MCIVKIGDPSFRRNDSGNMAIMFGLVSMVAIAAVGGALDFGKAYNMRSKMQNALDSAIVSGLAAYRESSDWSAAQAKAQAVFQAHFTNTMIWDSTNPKGGLDQPVLHIEQSNGKLSGYASATVNTPFMQLVIGKNYQILSVSSGEPASGKKLEVAIMMDVTGSMGATAGSGGTATSCSFKSNPTTKLDFLKCAGEDLLNILLPTSGANSQTVRIGVAPFADYVNAGEYADNVTGLPATGGAYAPVTNLSQTRQRSVFSGTYSGFTAGGSGSQYGTVASVGSPGTSGATSASTFSNGYCANPTQSSSVALRQVDSKNYGIRVGRYTDSYGNYFTGDAPAGLKKLTSGYYARVNRWNMTNGLIWRTDYGTSLYANEDDGYYVPVPQSTTGLTIQTRTHDGFTGEVGIGINYYGSASSPTVPSYLKPNTSSFWRVDGINADGSFRYTRDYNNDTGYSYYLPLYTSLTTTTTEAGCESAPTTASSKLITCVTERVRTNGTGAVTGLDYTDDAPTAGNYIGAYNHGSSSKYNYSSDGKCWVSGRELPAVVPLTNNRSTLESLFMNATSGGATPGHLGTAWASYLLSPHWSGVWPSSSTPVAYNDSGTLKAAILMTDGEYNLQFSMAGSTANTSAKQALELCSQMRQRGIHVFTIGFGFAANATPPSPNIEGMSAAERVTVGGTDAKSRALDTLAKCASSNSSYKFPYDGEALRQAFKDIANTLNNAAKASSSLITN